MYSPARRFTSQQQQQQLTFASGEFNGATTATGQCLKFSVVHGGLE